MILQALDAYYRRRQVDPDPAKRLPAFGLEDKEIPFILEIDRQGKLINLTDTRSGTGKKKQAQRFLVPQGVKKTSGIAANLLWDTAEYVLGIDTRGNPQRVAQQHQEFINKIKILHDDACDDEGLLAVMAFLQDLDPALLDAWPSATEIKETNPALTFRLHGDLNLVCQRQAIVAAANAMRSPDDQPDGICLVTNKPAVIERLHPAIKGVWGAQTSGANIVSFNLDAFNSYSKTQGANAPLGQEAVFTYTTALNHLLAKNSRQRIQVGDTSTVFWAAEPHELEETLADIFGELEKQADDPGRNVRAVEALYNAVQSGNFSAGGPTTRFHVLGLAPNAARISVRFWLVGTAAELAGRIKQHFDDLETVHAPHEPRYLSLFRLLTSLAVMNKADNIPPNLGGEIMRAVLEGLPYPAAMLNLAVQRCRTEQKPTYPRTAAIKACLNRMIRSRKSSDKEFLPMLDTTNTDTAYRLGRLFATLEKIQEEASPGLNATIRDRYYGAASSVPVTVFTTLLRLKNHHLGKLPRGRAAQMERHIGEIMNGINDFPRQLTLSNQGRFALGYYHQRQAFFTKPESNNNQE
jgi:CRISPR-associated protein Csd1